MKIDEYFVNTKKWQSLIETNRDSFLLYYKYADKTFSNKMNKRYSLFVYKTFTNIQCTCCGGLILWEFNPTSGKIKIFEKRCDQKEFDETFEMFYKKVLDIENKVNR